jgi:TPR repeat protein
MGKYIFLLISLAGIVETRSLVYAKAEPVPAPTADQLLAAGKYSQIPAPKKNNPHDHAVWAFAQYHLAPNREVAKAAQFAHDKGDELGTFVWMMCHRTGVGVARDRSVVSRLNFELRTMLEKREKLTPVELYILGQCGPGDETGKTINPDVEKLFAELARQRKLAAKRIKEAADLGFAQACVEIAAAQDDRAEKYKWYRKAADLGSAEGKRYVGLFLVFGAGVEKDEAKGLEISRSAAQEGDVKAMINLVVFYDQGKGVKKDSEEVQRWLSAAAKSGHWFGSLEKGMSQLEGHYGSKVDREAGLLALQAVANSGHGEALNFLGTAYVKGFGVKENGTLAVEFAEAAYRQGDPSAASVLALVYSKGLGEIKADEDLAGFWGREASKPGFGVDLMEEKARERFLKRIDAIDPFALKVK